MIMPLTFGSPLLLIGLLALPAIWWLLRMTPPKPNREVFPPLKILANIFKSDTTPSKSPWWLTLLRLIIAGLVILALANPVWKPQKPLITGSQPIAVILDNSWSSATDWQLKKEAASRIIIDAQNANAPIYILGTANKLNAQIGPFEGKTALDALNAMQPMPVAATRTQAFQRLAQVILPEQKLRVAYLNNGLKAGDDSDAFNLLKNISSKIFWFQADISNLAGLSSLRNDSNGLTIEAIRPSGVQQPAEYNLIAYDLQSRPIAQTKLTFASNAHKAEALFTQPIELRNDFAAIRIEGQKQAGAVRLVDESNKRRRVALISGQEIDMAQPLLSPLYYISKTLEPYADLIRPQSADLLETIPALLAQKPDIIVMTDIGKLPFDAEQQLSKWINEDGGTLIRFAGDRLAAATTDDSLLPVKLRRGERSLGGTLSWSEPQPLADFSSHGPFAGLNVPDNVTISRQILAEPSPELLDKTFASLADGTPLVTGEKRGRGQISFFHIAPDATWSNLPISGTFVDMMRNILMQSASLSSQQTLSETKSDLISLPPYQILTAQGELSPPTAQSRPLVVVKNEQPTPSLENPPGFYGNEEGFLALNLLKQDSKLEQIEPPQALNSLIKMSYEETNSVPLRGILFAIAALLLALDTFLMILLSGKLRKLKKHGSATSFLLALLFSTAILGSFLPSQPAYSQTQPVFDDSKPNDADFIKAASATHLGFIKTGNAVTDALSLAGLRGLGFILNEKTTITTGEPVGLDPESDELSFYPIIYWPINPDSSMPSDKAIARVNAYMQQGGTVLFDTQDQYEVGANFSNQQTPANQRLRQILENMNIPPLEAVPADHVLSKSFYIMPDFPGRYRGGTLWIEASRPTTKAENRPVRTGDGVSPILITSNDFAGAWATNEQGDPLYPTVPNDPMQRIYAQRAGINIIMYMLTGNYKSDQVHVPDLLERLGN